jgi:hypothetical protein
MTTEMLVGLLVEGAILTVLMVDTMGWQALSRLARPVTSQASK